MKPYGVEIVNTKCPDVAEIQRMGAKSSCGRLREKGGDFKSYIRNPEQKRRQRRWWKKRERSRSKALCKDWED